MCHKRNKGKIRDENIKIQSGSGCLQEKVWSQADHCEPSQITAELEENIGRIQIPGIKSESDGTMN
jgi:hypothetical protein